MMKITEGGLDHPAVKALLIFHIQEARRNSPPDMVFALPEEGLRQPGVRFFSVWEGEMLLGIGAVKKLSEDHAEIKSMRSAPDQLRRGVARMILAHLLEVAADDGATRISLETGRTAPFHAAHALYQKFGFVECPPFGEYEDNGFSMCMTKEL